MWRPLRTPGRRHLVIDQRRRPHAVTARRVQLRAQRMLPFTAETRGGDAGAASEHSMRAIAEELD